MSPACGSDSGNTAYICLLNEDLLHRAPDAGGISFYTDQFSVGVSRRAVTKEILDSTEYRMGLISSYYNDYLGRAADASGSATFLAQFAHGASDEDVQLDIFGSPEFSAKTSRKVPS